MNKKADVKKIERISKALGDPYRIQILEAINKKEEWMPCTAVLGMFNLAQSTVSHHLKQLVEAGLLLAQKDGRYAKYKVNRDAFGDYVRFFNNYKEEK